MPFSLRRKWVSLSNQVTRGYFLLSEYSLEVTGTSCKGGLSCQSYFHSFYRIGRDPVGYGPKYCGDNGYNDQGIQ